MNELVVIPLLFCQFLLILFGIFLIWSWLTKTPFYPSSGRKLKNLINSGEINLPKDKIKFVDIGSGDGRIVLAAASLGWNADGIEYNPFLSLFSRFLLWLNRKSKLTKIWNKDFRNHNYSDYNVIYFYIFGEHMDEIKEKILKEVKPGSVIISSVFTFNNLKPDQKVRRYNIYYIK